MESAAVRLHSKKPRVFWGKVIHTLIQQGWNPPTPDEKVTDEIIRAIENIMESGSVALLGKDIGELSVNQAKLVALIADGYSNDEIAEIMGIATQTVKYHIAEIMMKLHAKNRSHAVALALREGIIR